MLGFISPKLLRSSSTKSPISPCFVAAFNFVRHYSEIQLSRPSSEDVLKIESFPVSDQANSEPTTSAGSKAVRLTSPGRPNGVLNFLKNQGFKEDQISNLLAKQPKLMMADPEATLKPRFELLASLGGAKDDVVKIFLHCPEILNLNLDKSLRPNVEYLRSILRTNENVRRVMVKCRWLLKYNLPVHLTPRVEFFRKEGMSDDKIVEFLRQHPTGVFASLRKLEESFARAREMGFHPMKYPFIDIVGVLVTINDKTWERKAENFKKWGFSDSDVLDAFKKHPRCMLYSLQRVDEVIECLLNSFGSHIVSHVVHYPIVLAFSLKKRIIPRCFIVHYLLSKEVLTEKDLKLSSVVGSTEDTFLQKFVKKYTEVVPELFDLYTKFKKCATIGDSDSEAED